MQKTNTIAGLTDNTIYGVQPSNPGSPNNNFNTQNSNFKSIAMPSLKIPQTLKQENDILVKMQEFMQQPDDKEVEDLTAQNQKDGIVLKNVNSQQMKIILDFMAANNN